MSKNAANMFNVSFLAIVAVDIDENELLKNPEVFFSLLVYVFNISITSLNLMVACRENALNNAIDLKKR